MFLIDHSIIKFRPVYVISSVTTLIYIMQAVSVLRSESVFIRQSFSDDEEDALDIVSPSHRYLATLL